METTTNITETSQVYTREAIEMLSRSNNEPQWLLNKRLRSWAIYADMSWNSAGQTPHISKRFGKDELHLEQLSLPGVSPATGKDATDLMISAQNVSTDIKHRSGLLVQHNNTLVRSEHIEELKAKGVIFCDMATAAREHGDLLEQYLLTNAVHLNDNKLVALHGAFWNGGTFVYIPKNVKVEFPLQSFYLVDEAGKTYSPHTLIIGEKGSEAVVIDTQASPDLSAQSFVNGAVEIYAAEGSKIHFISLQEYGKKVNHYAMKRAIAGKDAKALWCEVSIGADVSRVNIEAIMEESGSYAELLGIYFPTGDQKMEFNTLQSHVAPHAISDLLYKGALRGNARSIFEGLIRVHPGAQKTNAYQANRNMLLSSGSRADSIPQLEIEANDVRCTHGATVGPINEDQLFYLMSRGLSHDAAVKLLVTGFFSQVIDRIPVEDVREGLLRHIENQIS